jgi:hypothetical protein
VASRFFFFFCVLINIFSSTDPCFDYDLLDPIITEEEDVLYKIPDEKEIIQALYQVGLTKALWLFYKSHWLIVLQSD